jgi:hypothetical protein
VGPSILEFYQARHKFDHAYTQYIMIRSFLAGYQRKQEMKQDENEYLLNQRL